VAIGSESGEPDDVRGLKRRSRRFALGSPPIFGNATGAALSDQTGFHSRRLPCPDRPAQPTRQHWIRFRRTWFVVAAVAALKRIASLRAALIDLGPAHGMRSIFVKKNNAFQMLCVVPDGPAAIGRVMWDASGHEVTRRRNHCYRPRRKAEGGQDVGINRQQPSLLDRP
jgi:hypothetical protein